MQGMALATVSYISVRRVDEPSPAGADDQAVTAVEPRRAERHASAYCLGKYYRLRCTCTCVYSVDCSLYLCVYTCTKYMFCMYHVGNSCTCKKILISAQRGAATRKAPSHYAMHYRSTVEACAATLPFTFHFHLQGPPYRVGPPAAKANLEDQKRYARFIGRRPSKRRVVALLMPRAISLSNSLSNANDFYTEQGVHFTMKNTFHG